MEQTQQNKYALSITLGEIVNMEVSHEGIDLFSFAQVCFDKDHIIKAVNKTVRDLKKYIVEYFNSLEGMKQ